MGSSDICTISLQRTVAFGDCDPAGIVYTPRVFDFCLEAIDLLWKRMLEGKGWYELNIDLDRGTPFVNVNMDFSGPITPREKLEITARLAHVGRTSVTFEVSARQAGTSCFKGTLTSVIVKKSTMSKVQPDDWTLLKIRALTED